MKQDERTVREFVSAVMSATSLSEAATGAVSVAWAAMALLELLDRAPNDMSRLDRAAHLLRLAREEMPSVWWSWGRSDTQLGHYDEWTTQVCRRIVDGDWDTALQTIEERLEVTR